MANVTDTIIVKVNDEDREIFMSFGLLNELTKIVEDPANVSAISVDADLREAVLNSLLAKRKESGKISEKADILDTKISVEDVENLIEWSSEHVLSFFVRSLKKVMALTKKHQGDVKGLASFVNGFTDLASETPSAGPSESLPTNSNEAPTG